jgi:hypothetical protein
LRRAFGGGGGPDLRLSQSLGAFAGPGGDISPLHVFFEATNAGSEEVEIVRVLRLCKRRYAARLRGAFRRGSRPALHAGARGILPFHARAKALAGALKEAGHGGRPRVRLVVEDASGNRREKAFRFRVDEYLELKDE